MTPKEKARELVDKMHNSEHCGIKHFPNKKYCECVEMNLFQAKQCALIAVDEIIKTYTNKDGTYFLLEEEVDYWNKVKTEIENL